MKILKYITYGLIIVVAISALNYIWSDKKFGYYPSDWYSGGVTNSSSTVYDKILGPNASSTILSRNTNRIYASICSTDDSKVWIHETDSTSSLRVQEGFLISGRTTTTPCYIIDANHLYRGAVMGIANATTNVSIIEK